MIYPDFLKPGDRIGVSAFSCGVTDEPGKRRFQNARKKLMKKGYDVAFTENVFTSLPSGASSSGQDRAKQLLELVEDPQTKAIISAAGGSLLVEMLPYIDFDQIKAHPKWIQGYSDNTSLLYYLTAKYDIATSYSNNFGEFGMQNWEKHVRDNLAVLEGHLQKQESYPFYEPKKGFEEDTEDTAYKGHTYTEPVLWNEGTGKEEQTIEGRLIGGCLDVLFFLAGTRYDATRDFISRYKEDGILWYFESFQANADDLQMHLWQLKEMGWFEHTKGILFGRPLFFESWDEKSYQDTVMYMLKDLHVPILFDADFGHVVPRMTMINGAFAKVDYKDHKAEIKYTY